jgi:type VI protein secretion system component Hcp
MEQRIKNLEPGQRVEIADDVEPGLFARVRQGKKGRTVNFIWRRNHDGRRLTGP